MIFLMESLHDFLWRYCVIFLLRGCMIFFAERLHDFCCVEVFFVCGEVA